MRNVLIAYATRLGAAHEIADAIARELWSNGDQVRVECLQDAPQVRDAELVVVGSGINAGRFYPEAVAWLNANQPNLESTTVAVFNTCLNAADPGKQDEALGYNASAVELIGAAASATFAGRYEKSKTGFFGRLLLRILRKPEQDNVDRAAARAWAQELVEL